MLEKPDLPDAQIVACLQDGFGVQAVDVSFLPLGADFNTAVYRVVAEDRTPYFLKLRRGPFDTTAVSVPHFLRELGIKSVIPLLETRAGELWTHVQDFTAILSPFVVGRNGFEVGLTDQQRVEMGAALRGIHSTELPRQLSEAIPRESYTPQWRDLVRGYQRRVQTEAFADPIAASMAGLMSEQRGVIAELTERAERLARALRPRLLPLVLCHADIHAGNLLIDGDSGLHIVDWDTLIFAPKERDLMFIGAGIDELWRRPREQALFYQGYGPVEIDMMALAYYRCERIVQDIVAFCDQILATDGGGEDRAQGLRYFASNFLPTGTIELAFRTPFN